MFPFFENLQVSFFASFLFFFQSRVHGTINYNFNRDGLKLFSRVPRIGFKVKTNFFPKKAKFDLVVRVKAKNKISRSRKQNRIE